MALYDPPPTAMLSALSTLQAAAGDIAAIESAAAALLTQVETAPSGALREAARLRVTEALLFMRYDATSAPNQPGAPSLDAGLSCAHSAVMLATRAINGGAL